MGMASPILIVVMALLALQASAQMPTSCTSTIAVVYECIGFITSSSNGGNSGSDCCTKLAEAAANAAMCLCQVFGTNSPLGFPLNETQYLVLPGTCNVKIPPLDQCTEAGTLLPSSGSNPSETAMAPVPSADSPTDASKDVNPRSATHTSDGKRNTGLGDPSGSPPMVAASLMGLLAGLSMLTLIFTIQSC